MQKQVQIRMLAFEDGTKTEEYHFSGRMQEKNGRCFVLYQEKNEKGELLPSALRIEKDRVAVLRHESLGGHLTFDPAHPKYLHYHTPYGPVVYHFHTRGIQRKENELGMELKLEYTLQPVSEEGVSDEDTSGIHRMLVIQIDTMES